MKGAASGLGLPDEGVCLFSTTNKSLALKNTKFNEVLNAKKTVAPPNSA